MIPARFPLFLAATLALTLTPGPAVLFVVARSAGQGRQAGLLSVLGIALGNAIHTGAAALGVAALLASSPLAFAAVKYLGAGYLVLLGLRRLLDRGSPGLVPGDRVVAPPPPRAVLRQAFLVALLNPKTALFFLAFLPQFAEPGRGAIPAQLALLGLTFVLVAAVTDSGYAWAADGLGRFLRGHPGFAQVERWVAGAVFIGLGLAAAASGLGGAATT